MMQELPIAFYLDTRRAMAKGKRAKARGEHAGKYPVKIRVDFSSLLGKRSQSYYKTGIYLSEQEFEKAISERPGRSLRDVSDRLVSLKAKAISIIRDSPAISPELFELLYSGKAIQSANVEVLFDIQVASFDKAGKIKSRDSYDSAKNSILDFADGRQCSQCQKWFNPSRMQAACNHKLKAERQKSGLLLNNIDKDFLVRYQAWMRQQGNSVTTVSIYLRNLRKVFNEAIRLKIISRDLYPFGERGFAIPESNNLKKAYNDNQLIKLFSYVPDNESEAYALDFWKLFYYSDGINPIDICYLTKENMSEDIFKFFRRKTLTTRRVQVEKSVFIQGDVEDVFNRRAVHSPYLFGVINPNMDAQQQRNHVEYWVRRINNGMKSITEKLQLPRATTYTARHSVATKYIRAGVDIVKIKDLFVHASVATTEKYTKGIEGAEEQRELSRLLIVPRSS